MIITSLKSTEELDSIYVTYFPKEIIWENYPIAMQRAKMGRLIFNTVYVGVISTLGTLVTTIFAAFAFSRLKFIGRDLMFTLFLATMMIPGEMMVITNFITVSKLGWIDTYSAMIVPFLVSVFYIYLL
jgi:multiple sugar transport system permease protein